MAPRSLRVPEIRCRAFASCAAAADCGARIAAAHDADVYDRPFYRRFRALVNWCVAWRKTVILVTVAVFALSMFGFRFVQQQFFPSSNRPELIVDLWLPQGASFQATEAQVRRFEDKLKGDANIENYVAYVGNGSPRFYLPLDQQLGHPNFAQFVIVTRDNDAREIMVEKLNRILETEFSLLRGRVNRLENGPPVGYPVQFRVVGNDIPAVRRIALEVAEIVRAHPNTQNVHLDWNEQVKTIGCEIDQNKARVIGVSSQGLSTGAQFDPHRLQHHAVPREGRTDRSAGARRNRGAPEPGQARRDQRADAVRKMDPADADRRDDLRLRRGHHLAAQPPAYRHRARGHPRRRAGAGGFNAARSQAGRRCGRRCRRTIESTWAAPSRKAPRARTRSSQ